MVHFSDTMTRLRRSEYADKYIDYQALRRQLGELKDVYDREAAAAPGKEDNQAVSHPRNRETRREDIERAATDKGPRRSTKHLSPMEYLRKSLSVERFDLEENIEIVELEEHFTHSLGAQVGNVLSFFQQQVEDLENELLAIHRQSEETPATGTSLRDPDLRRTDVRGQLETLGNKVLHLIQYLHVNVATLEKLLGQHDEQVRQRHVPKFCASAQALAKFESMRDLCGNKRFLSLVDGLRTATTSMEGKGGDGMDAGDSDDELDDLQTELDLNLARRNVEDGIHRGTSGSRIYPLTRSPGVRGLLGAIAEEQETLTAAEGHTVTNFLSLEVLPTPRMCTFEDEEFPDHRTLELHQANVLIALATSFMDMVNYYIAEPASSRYASALGASPAASGIIIGMTPLAGCLSCLLFSWWTNTSFKNPLLLCISLLVVGNLLYGLAITFDAYWMVLLGRILIGFGGTRSVCRRYIAGNIPANARTGYSAAFVASGSLGMAFGPVFAILAERIVLNVGALEFNGLTNPGWFMSLGWLSLGLLVIFMFKDPHRKSRSDLHTLMLCKRPTERDAWEDSAEVAPGGVETPDVLGGSWPDDAQPSVRFGALDSYGTIESKPGRFECLQHVWGVADLDASRKRSPGRRPGDPSGSGRKDRDEERWGLLRMPMANARNTKATGTVNVWPRAPPSPSSSERTDSSSEDEEGSTCGEGYVAQSAPTPPLLFCLFGSFVNKLVYEVTVSSAPLLTGYMFGWSMAHVGTMMAALGLMVLPVNVLVARLSLIVEDRLLLQILSSLAGLGCVLIISSPAIPLELKEMQYILGVWLICAALQAHEGVSMSITSKITPIHLARSTYNPGLLSTGLGTFGRLLGDLTISFGGFVSLQWLDVFLFTPAASLITVMAIGCWIVFPYLRV